MRTIRRPVRMCAAVLALAACSGVAAAPVSVSGCVECHGDNGVSAKSAIPTIAGMSEFYLEGQMDAYKKGQRPCAPSGDTDMCQVAKKMSDAEVKESSTFYAGQKFSPAAQPVDATLAAKGKSIHQAQCESCHSDGGSQAADDAGLLAGQWKPYLVAMLKEYHDGKRVQPEKMKPHMVKLTDDDIKALAEFYASLGSK